MRFYQFGENLLEDPTTFIQSRGNEHLAYWITQVGSPPITTTMTILLVALTLANASSTWSWIGFYIVFAVVVPVLYIGWLYHKGEVTDIHLRVREQRIKPLLVTLTMALLAWLVLHVGGAPELLVAVVAANGLQTTFFLAITTRWKISAHSASAAAMAVLAWLLMGYTAVWFILCVPIIAWARIRLRRHTIAQTVAGAALGSSTLTLTLYFYWG